jgi:hypothetical protein
MPQIIIPLALAAAQAGYSAHKASKQRKMANKLKQQNLTPQAVEEALASEKLRSTASSPEYLRGLEKLNQSSANALSQSKRIGGTTGQVQQSVADADARRREGIKDLQIADSGFKANSRANVQSLLMEKGGYQAEAREQKESAQAALRGAAETNEGQAVSHGLNAAAIGGQHAIDNSKWGRDAAAKAAAKAAAGTAGKSFQEQITVGDNTAAPTRAQGLNRLNGNARPHGGGNRLSNQPGRFNNARRYRGGPNRISPGYGDDYLEDQYGRL